MKNAFIMKSLKGLSKGIDFLKSSDRSKTAVVKKTAMDAVALISDYDLAEVAGKLAGLKAECVAQIQEGLSEHADTYSSLINGSGSNHSESFGRALDSMKNAIDRFVMQVSDTELNNTLNIMPQIDISQLKNPGLPG